MNYAERAVQVFDAALGGTSLDELARVHRVTRERIRQVLAREWGRRYPHLPPTASLRTMRKVLGAT